MKYILISFYVFSCVAISPILAKDYSPQECPVVGNSNSRIYHVPGGKSYAKILRQNRRGDNRVCFQTEQEAQGGGYRRAKR